MDVEDFMNGFYKGSEYSDAQVAANKFAEMVWAFQNAGFTREESIFINLEMMKTLFALNMEDM